jgi:hypothetical protein
MDLHVFVVIQIFPMQELVLADIGRRKKYSKTVIYGGSGWSIKNCIGG